MTEGERTQSALLQEELISIREYKMKGVLLRSRARWVAEGEKITKYFCGLEKRNYVSKQVNKRAASNGSELHEAEDIIQEVKTFYERLYQKKQLEECENVNDMTEDTNIDAAR